MIKHLIHVRIVMVLEDTSMEQIKEKKKKNFLVRYFKITDKGATSGKELLGGLIVFLAMLYILPVNTNILSDTGMSSGAVFAATAICSAICTIFMGVFSKYPVALSAGMGMNAFIAYTVCGTLGYTWGESLTLIFFAGVLFFKKGILKWHFHLKERLLETATVFLKSYPRYSRPIP